MPTSPWGNSTCWSTQIQCVRYTCGFPGGAEGDIELFRVSVYDALDAAVVKQSLYGLSRVLSRVQSRVLSSQAVLRRDTVTRWGGDVERTFSSLFHTMTGRWGFICHRRDF